MKKQSDTYLGAIVNKSNATKTYVMAYVSAFPKRSRLYEIGSNKIAASSNSDLSKCHCR